MSSSPVFLSRAAELPGAPRFVVRTDPQWDFYTREPSEALKSWFQMHVWRMMVYSPYWDDKLGWYPNAWVYINLYAIPANSTIPVEHPDWILKDREGNRLYIPYACTHGACPQFAGDIRNNQFRQDWIRRATTLKHKGYRGLFVDDVNLEFRVSDGFGRERAPWDAIRQQGMSYESWKQNVADFVEQIRRAFPTTEIVHNAIWYAGGPRRDADPSVAREIAAADFINLERGFTDRGLTGGAGPWSVDALLAYIDRVHKLGPGVILDNLDGDIQYCLATYFLISTGRDSFGNHTLFPTEWPRELTGDLGMPLEPRQSWHGLIRRVFSNGVAIINPPNGPVQKLISTSGLRKSGSTPQGSELSLHSPGGAVLVGPVARDGSTFTAIKVPGQ